MGSGGGVEMRFGGVEEGSGKVAYGVSEKNEFGLDV